MNKLNVSLPHSILTLWHHGWSFRRIARELHLRRETVSKYVHRQRDSKPAKVPAGSPGLEVAPEVPAGLPARSRSQCEPWREVIEQGLRAGLSAQRLYQDLVERQYAGSYDAVKRFVRRLQAAAEVPFCRIEVEPGVEAQVDFGVGAWVVEENGKRRRPNLYRIVLSHSRKGYTEAVWRQRTEDFIRCLENSFRSWGGVPRTLVIDNLRAAVHQADWYDPELNAKVAEFCRHYGTVILPCKPAMPHHKGKVEAGVKYAQNNALKGRTFPSLAGQNQFLLAWENGVADTRIHGTTRQQVGKVFHEVERPKLLPLPPDLFPMFEEAPRTVHQDGYIELQRAYYSVPPPNTSDAKCGRAGNRGWCACSTSAGKSSPFMCGL
ncbi:MAG TPA: IS21 family transposase, partial [Verrucomicrobiae bacterium]|nr:IS21 family transposase [Verrucomicrobiae bacterium]